jgi:hypothetical protein
MGKGSVSGIAEKYHPVPAPPRQPRQLDQGPVTHVPLDVTYQVKDATIPRVFLKDAQGVFSGSRYAI